MSQAAVLEAERATLGAILLNVYAFDEANSLGLLPEEFSLDSYRRIYRAMSVLAESGTTIDSVTLVNYLDAQKELEIVGGAVCISDLIAGVPDRPSIKHYARIVRDQACKRQLIGTCGTIAASLSEGMATGEALGYLSDQMLRIQAGNADSPSRRVTEFSEATYDKWLAIANGSDDLIGLPTGANCLDLATTGIREGEYWIVAGRKADGKTNLALQMIAANCERDNAVGMFSIEMKKEALLQRLWAGEGQIDFNNIRFPRRLSSEIKMRIERAMVAVGKWPLHIIEDSDITLQKLVAKAQLLIRGEHIKLLVIDYIQLINAKGRDERERTTAASRAILSLAKDTGVPIIAISQLARPRDGNENFRPTSFNLKESGSLENDAHVVILIYRPVDDRKMKTHEDELIIDKQRSGMTSIEPVTFMPWLRFCERTSR
jgi:replicative DNA helicase